MIDTSLFYKPVYYKINDGVYTKTKVTTIEKITRRPDRPDGVFLELKTGRVYFLNEADAAYVLHPSAKTIHLE